MSVLDEVRKALELIPGWKRIASLATEVDALRERVAAIEARLEPATGDQCPSCRAMAFRLVASKREDSPFGDLGAMEDHYVCNSCGYTDIRQRSL